MFGFKPKKEAQPTLFGLPTLPLDESDYRKPNGKAKGRVRAPKFERAVTIQGWKITHAIVNDQKVTGKPVNPDDVDGSDVKRSFFRPTRAKQSQKPTSLSIIQSRNKNSQLNALPPRILDQNVDTGALAKMAALVKKKLSGG